jgi:hypothetical protein
MSPVKAKAPYPIKKTAGVLSKHFKVLILNIVF